MNNQDTVIVLKYAKKDDVVKLAKFRNVPEIVVLLTCKWYRIMPKINMCTTSKLYKLTSILVNNKRLDYLKFMFDQLVFEKKRRLVSTIMNVNPSLVGDIAVKRILISESVNIIEQIYGIWKDDTAYRS
jgi:hypothetical protein